MKSADLLVERTVQASRRVRAAIGERKDDQAQSDLRECAILLVFARDHVDDEPKLASTMRCLERLADLVEAPKAAE